MSVAASHRDVLYTGRPSAWWILIAWPASLLIPFLLAYAARWILMTANLPDAARWAMMAGWGVLALGLIWRVIEWLSRRYSITITDATIRAGVITKVGADIPIRNVQHVTLYRSFFEQLLGLGSIGIATAGSDGPVAYLVMVSNPKHVMDVLERAAEAARAAAAPKRARRPIVVGLAGGIGAGKSAVARAFADRGALVIDSDKEAKDALDRPEVRGELIRWWGDGVLGSDGRIDRKKVGSIIFADAAQRERLERLVHPLVRTNRAEMIARSDPRMTPMVVLDAPLLFEVGLEKECDAVVFVDAPREQRLDRVRATRGWDVAELSRREKAQLPLEEKRRRADHVISNDSSVGALGARAERVFEMILEEARSAGR